MSFSLSDFFINENKQILVNNIAQYAALVNAQNSICAKLLLLIFSNSKLVVGFIQILKNVLQQSERAPTL